MGNFFINLFKRFTTSKRKLSPFLRPPQLTFLEERITPATIIVNSLADNTTADAFTTLREAITTANASADADTIEFASSLFTGGAGTITLGSSLPAIVTATTAGTLTITGPGSSSLTISGSDPTNPNNATRDFNIFNIASGGNLSISGVTVSGARYTSGSGGAFNNQGTLAVSNSTLSGNSAGTFGGAIFNNNGALTVTNSALSGNNATYGGGISNKFGTLTLTNSTLSGNSAGTSGGGIHNNGFLTVSNSTISGNSATTRHGGGIFNNSNLNVTNSTLSGNSASSSGGGIYNSGTLLTLTNSTLSNNSASNGGGIRNSNNLTITNSTFSGNSASSNGGGINNSGTLNIANTIIANSTSGGDYAGNGTVTLIPSGNINNPTISANNIVTQASSSATSAWAQSVTSAQLNLGPLQNNGGPTFTQALLLGSVAIAAGNSTISNASPVSGKDQRGVNRITSDIGAYSFGIQVTTTAASGTGSLDAAITLANNPGNDDINFNLTGSSPYTITLAAALPTILNVSTAGTLTINGLGASALTISGSDPTNVNNSTRNFNIFNVTTGGNLTISGVTVSGAQTTGEGGAFKVDDGTLSIFDSIISDNKARIGGGIYSIYGNVTVNKSTLSGNSAISNGGGGGGEGGGIANFQNSKLYINSSTLTGNSATTNGGGIYNISNGNITVTNSTIASNTANNGGGGIYNKGTFTVSNSTIASNTGTNGGGGILSTGTGIGTITNSTLSGNNATTGSGGIYNIGTLNIANTIIANSTSGGDFAGNAPSTNTNNLVETLGTVTGGTFTPAFTADPLLGPLQNNGGPTFTMALLPGSIAIGNGNSTISNASPISGKDQRGINRTTSDIGAYSFGIQVTNTSDDNTVGSGSLRAAINLANLTPGNDQISVNLTGANPYTITLAGALPTIVSAATAVTGGTAGTVTITGLGASSLTISGSDPTNLNNSTRNFNIFNIASGGNLSISGVTVSGAKTSGNGGAFNNSGILSVLNSTLSGNTAIFGGGVYNAGSGILNFSNSTVSGNSAGQGGAIANSGGTVIVTNSTVSGNSANQGGGIANTGTVAFTNSTLSDNTAIFGGGVFNDGGGILNFSNSTVSGNSAGQGGGIANNGGTVTVTNSTVSGNSANQGGGIANTGTLNIANTIIANSTNGGDFAGNQPVTSTNNIVEDGSITNGAIAADPLLGPLANNGGPTFTQALLPGSPAIGAGNATISNASPVFGKDQRGFVRTTSDIGAYSYNFASAGDAVVSLDNTNQVVLTLSSSGTAITDFHTTYNSGANTLTITAATTGTLLTAPSAGIAGISINGSTDTITLDLNLLVNFAGIVIVGNSGTGAVTIGAGGVDLSAVTTGAANLSFTANILGTSNSTSALVLTNAIKTKGTAATYLSAGTINGSGLITTPSITLLANTGIGNTTALNLAATSISADSNAGKIDLNNALASAVTVTSLTSAGKTNPNGALITFDQSGGGTVTFNNVSSAGSVDGFGVITLTNAGGGITIAGTGVSTAGTTSTISLTTTGSGNIAVNAAVDAGLNDGDVNLTSAGNISGTGLITGAQASLVANTGINANMNFSLGFSTITSPAGNISVTNVYGIAVQNAITTTGDVSLTSGQNIVLLNPITATGKTVTLTAQGGGIYTFAGKTITANSVDLDATTGIGQADGDIPGTVPGLNLAAFFVSADTNSGAININNTSGTAVSVTSLTTTGSDGITFNQTGLGGIGIDGPVSTGTGTITITSQKGISGTGLFTQANAAGVVTFNAGAGDITLTNAGNNFTGSVSLSNTGANNVAITDANTIDFGASTLGSGTFTVTAVGITQSGAITQGSGAGSATFNAGAGVITLANASNDFTGSVALNSTGATVAITDTNALALASPNLGANTGITAIAGTTLTLPSFNFSTGTGNIDFQSASGTLATNGTLTTSSGTVSLKGSAGVTVGHNITTTTGAVSVTGAGINLTSGNTIDAGSSTITLDGKDGAITLTGALTTTNNTSAAIVIQNASTVSLGDITTGATGFVTLGGATTDNLTGAVTQTGVITTGTLVGNTAGDVTLLGANTITNLGTFTSTGTGGFSLNDLGGLTVSGNVNNTSGAVSIVTTVSPLTISADITATSQSLTLTGVGINQTTGTILAAGLTVNAGAGSIALTQANNNFTGSVTLNSTGASVAITDINAIDFAASTLGSGTFTVTAVGITQSGAITVAGTSSFNAGAGVITLTQSNDFTGLVSLNNSGTNNVTIVDSNDITIGVTSLGTGTFAVTGSNIKLNSNVTTTNNIQTYTGNVVVNANSGGLPLVLSSGSGAIDITSNVDSASGFNHSLTFTSTGDVTIGGTIGGTQALGTLLITGNDISLGNIGGANVGTTSNVSVQASDGADNGSITLTGTTYNTTGQQFYNSSAVASAFDATRLITLTGGSASTTVSLTSATGIETYGTIQLNNRVLSLNTSSGSSGFVTNDSKLPSLQVFEGPGSVVLDTGTSGPIVINGAIGTVGTPLNSMTITNAANAGFTGSIKVNTITITDTTDGGFVRFLGNLTVNTGMTVSPNGAYNVEILELSTIAGETTFGNSGLLTLGNAGSDVFNFTGGIIATTPSAINLIGTITAAGIGIITLGDSDTAINIKSASGFVGGTSTGTITLGNSILEDGVTLTVGTGITNAINLAAVTGTASGTSSNLTINTTGAVTVAGAVGTDIGLLTITNSGGTTFQSTVDAATTTITNTTGNVKFEGNLNLTTSLITANQGYNVSITGTSNNIAGATTFANTGAVTLGNGDSDSTTFAGGFVITAPASIAIQGTVATTNATMTLGDANTGITNNGTFSNPAILNAGAGIINLAGNVTGNGSNNPLKVTTSGVGFTMVSGVNTAELQLSSGVVTIANPSDQTGGYRVLGGTLQGGSMAKVGYIYAQTGTSTLAPGINGPGMMHTNSLLLSSGNTVEIDLQGTNPATGYDQIVVCTSGNVNLDSATLSLSSSFTGNQGTIFTIIDNQDPTTAIQGTFAGLSEGAVVSVNGRAYQISYVGGTGNDVTLTVYDPATVTSFTPTIGKSGTSVVITGTNFVNVSQVSFNGTVQPTYTVDSPTQITTTIPSGATTGTISITTIAGTATSSSTITIDNTAPTLSISASPGSLKANETSTITFTFSEVVTGFSSNIITVTNGTITNPVASSSTVYTSTFTPTLGIKADGTISVSNNYFDSVGNQGTAATLTPPIAINTVQTPLVTGGASTTQGGASVVSLIDPDTGEVIGSAAPFPGFTGQIRVVSGDFNGDGKVDIISAAGPGGGPAVAVLDSQTGEVIQSFFAFDPAFTGGVFIAVRDFNGDGILDIIAGAGAGGGPEVRIFNGNGLTVIRSFFAYAQDFTGGVSVANIDFNNDGILDLVTGAGPGGAPHVKVFDGATNSIISQWFAYPVSFSGGVYVAAGDIGNDGNIEVVTGAGSGGAPVVAVWDPYTGALLSQFMAYAEDFTGGVRVGVSDGNFDGILDLVTGAGPGGGPEVKGFSFPTLDLLFSFFSGDPTNTDGVFVS